MATDDPVVGYCEYLDKEMTIMGLLSAFSVIASGLILDRTAGAKATDQPALAALWATHKEFLLAGSLALLLAALAFYLQRSHLAYCYGQLRFSMTVAAYKSPSAKELLEDADSWATWTRYTTGFVLLGLGFIYLGIILIAPGSTAARADMWIALPAAAAVLFVVVNWFVKNKFEYSDRPWKDCLKWLRGASDGGRVMYGLIGKCNCAPGQRDALAAILLEGTHTIPGCLSYVIATDPADTDALWITEVWDGQASHQGSLSLPAIQAAIAKGRPMIAGFSNRVETVPLGGHGLAVS